MYRALACLVTICFICLLWVHGHVERHVLEQHAVGSDIRIDDPVQEILASWQLNNSSLKSYSFDIRTEELDCVFKKKTQGHLKIKVLMQQEGSCLVRLDHLDAADKPRESVLIVGARIYYLNHHEKTIYGHSLSKEMMKPDLVDFSSRYCPAVPFLLADLIELHNRFQITLVQKDNHYTWIRFIPIQREDAKNYSVAQVGVVNYWNAISPKHFPLRIMWRETGGKEVSWDFKEVLINNPLGPSISDFQINIAKLRKEQWKDRDTDVDNRGKVLWQWLLNEPIDWTLLQKK